jgi:hypothetical protein
MVANCNIAWRFLPTSGGGSPVKEFVPFDEQDVQFENRLFAGFSQAFREGNMNEKPSVREPGREIPVVYDVDVVVAGGGLAGFGAAWAAPKRERVWFCWMSLMHLAVFIRSTASKA